MAHSKGTDKRDKDLDHASGVLYRSRIEIGRILEKLRRQRATLSAEVGDGERLFLTRLLQVEQERNFIVTAFSDEQAANKDAVTRGLLNFVGHLEGARIEFEAAQPEDTLYDGKPAIRFVFPQALVRSQRREHPRIPVPSDVSLRCVADSAGIMPFEARIVDISLGGIGGMIYDPSIRLPVGTVLRGCKIVIPGRDAVVADVEVRYTASLIQKDGSLAFRSGVRFVEEPQKLQALIDVFVQDLDQTGK